MLAMSIVKTSAIELRRYAETMPSVMPTMIAKSRAYSVSSTVVGSRWISRSVTGRPNFDESPNSPAAISWR